MKSILNQLSTPLWEFLISKGDAMSETKMLYLSTPLWEFLNSLQSLNQNRRTLSLSFYSLMGVSLSDLVQLFLGEVSFLSTPLWEFRALVSEYPRRFTISLLSTPLWEFLDHYEEYKERVLRWREAFYSLMGVSSSHILT